MVDLPSFQQTRTCPLRQTQGATIPALCFGTSRRRGRECQALVEAAFEFGYRHLDTAQSYKNEDAIGQALAAVAVPRRAVFITTKLHLNAMRMSEVRPAVENSLEALKTSYIDLVLIHWPNPQVPLFETLAAIAALRSEGSVRLIGVSNFPTALLQEALSLDPALAANQIEYHPLLQQPALRRRIADAGMVLMASRPTAQGVARDHPVIVGIARRIGRAPHQVVLRWHLEQANVVVVPGASNAEQLRENYSATGFRLSQEDMSAIYALDAGRRTLDRPYAPKWDEDEAPHRINWALEAKGGLASDQS